MGGVALSFTSQPLFQFTHRADAFLGSTKGTISQTIKALERKGFIVKTPRQDEGRSICLSLTPKGADALNMTHWRSFQNPWMT